LHGVQAQTIQLHYHTHGILTTFLQSLYLAASNKLRS